MIRKIIVTDDKSKSLLIPDLDETYHSTYGAKNESQHIFIQNGLFSLLCVLPEIKIFEMGFGTGLNTLLTLEAIKDNITPIIYDTLEKYPVDLETIRELDHPTNTSTKHLTPEFNQLHSCAWGKTQRITDRFQFTKNQGDIISVILKQNYYNLIYFDAFAPKVQPDLWEYPVMQKLFDSLTEGGILITYCAQGQFRRNLKQAGFMVERLKGPTGKREITRATKQTVTV